MLAANVEVVYGKVVRHLPHFSVVARADGMIGSVSIIN